MQTDESSKKILCVEDDKDTCEMLGILLSDYAFTYVHSLNEAFSQIEKDRFDLFILDNWLPDGTGVDLCRKIRSLNRTPILFTSGVSHKIEIQKALDSGADEYLVKPYEPELLQKVVKELIEKERVSDYSTIV